MAPAIEVDKLALKYGKTVALNGISFEVPEGTVLGVLGPNGAGKTTAVRILATLLRATSGTARVHGLDVAEQPGEVRKIIGLTGQFAAVDEYLTGPENLEMVGRLFGLTKAEARRRADKLLAKFDLDYARDRTAKQYSGGMRRRLDIAASLIGQPKVVFLDEPTTGLDPRSRIAMWELIADLVKDGTTILLTTQYLEETDRLADNIIVLDRGAIVAEGTPDQLKSQVGGERLEFVITAAGDHERAVEILTPIGLDAPSFDPQTLRVGVAVGGGADDLTTALVGLRQGNVSIADVGLRRPNLDDVFLTLTGHAAEDGEESESNREEDRA